WSNIKKIIEKNEASVYHEDQKIGADNFCARGVERHPVLHGHTIQHSCRKKTRLIMTGIVDTVLFCGRQSIALRGHKDDMGNFKALLKLQAKHNAVLSAHLHEGDPRTMFTSQSIQNELIGIIGNIISRQIVNRCNAAGVFGFIAATMEQMALCVRYTKFGRVCGMRKHQRRGFDDSIHLESSRVRTVVTSLE
ncbi:LOW QUALITY PROTEIN: ZMYM1-like protein, partial [Mya arenaria]